MSDQKMNGKESRKGRLRRILDGAVTVLLVLAAALLVYVMISAAKGDIVVTMDADLQDNPEHIRQIRAQGAHRQHGAHHPHG